MYVLSVFYLCIKKTVNWLSYICFIFPNERTPTGCPSFVLLYGCLLPQSCKKLLCCLLFRLCKMQFSPWKIGLLSRRNTFLCKIILKCVCCNTFPSHPMVYSLLKYISVVHFKKIYLNKYRSKWFKTQCTSHLKKQINYFLLWNCTEVIY